MLVHKILVVLKLSDFVLSVGDLSSTLGVSDRTVGPNPDSEVQQQCQWILWVSCYEALGRYQSITATFEEDLMGRSCRIMPAEPRGLE